LYYRDAGRVTVAGAPAHPDCRCAASHVVL